MLVAMPISGFLSVYGFSGGWPSVFYFFGKFLHLPYVAELIIKISADQSVYSLSTV